MYWRHSKRRPFPLAPVVLIQLEAETTTLVSVIKLNMQTIAQSVRRVTTVR